MTQCRLPEHEEWKQITQDLILRSVIAEKRLQLKNLIVEIEALTLKRSELCAPLNYDPERGMILSDSNESTNGTAPTSPSSSAKPFTGMISD